MLKIFNSTTTDNTQEYFAWAGNGIFILAQIIQIIHTCCKKSTQDISYGLQILWLIGNVMYTIFGFIDLSMAMFIGSGATCITAFIQIAQKIYYDNCYKKKNNLLEDNYQAII